MKATIHSDHGSVMIIPHGKNVVRLYVQLQDVHHFDESVSTKFTASKIQEMAKKILQPYWIEWDRVEWYSVYPIRQSVAERYSIDYRIFIGGDACHTHSVRSPSINLTPKHRAKITNCP